MIVITSLPAISYAGSEVNILDKIKPNTITIIGETHKHPESITLFQSLISDYLKHNKCLTVGLEISSNQQTIMDKIKQGRATISDIDISPIIDHPPYRKMIDDLVKLQKQNSCLKIIAIDAGDDIDMGRDKWMAIKLAEQVGDHPILVLLGSLHTLKKVHWDLSITKGSPYVAEILRSQGYFVKTYPQLWVERNCSVQSHFVNSRQPEVLNLLNNSFISMLNAFEYKSAVNVVDGIILWECENN